MTTRRNVLASAAAAALFPAAATARSSPDADLVRLGVEWDALCEAGDFSAAEDAADRVMAVQPETLAGLAVWANVMVWRFDPRLHSWPSAKPPADLSEYGVDETFAIASAIHRMAAAQAEGRTS